MGLSTAWGLLRRGMKNITLLEQTTIPNPVGASGDDHRIIRRAYGAESAYGFMISEAFKAWARLWQDMGQNYLDMRGFAILSRSVGDEGEDYIHGLIKGGFPFEDLNAAALDRRFPFVEQQGLRRAVYSHEGGVLYSRQIALGLRDLLRAEGVQIEENTIAESIDADKAIVTTQQGGIYSADQLIITAGAWVNQIAPQLTAPLAPRQTYVTFLRPPPQYEAMWQQAPPFLDVGDMIDGYVLPPGNGCDLKFGSGLTRASFNAAKLQSSVAEEEAFDLRNLFSRAFKSIEDYEVIKSRRCAYIFTHNDRFWAFQQGRASILSPCSGHGYKFGAVIGECFADSLVAGEFDKFTRWLAGNVDYL